MSGVTTAFADVSAALLGDLVDVDGLLEVAKMHPDASSVHVPGNLVIAGGRRKRRSPVEKGTGALVRGFVAQARRLSGTTPLPQGTQAAVRPKAIAAGKGARADFNAFAGTKTGKAVLIGTAGTAALKGARRKGGQQYDEYGYAKRDEPGDITWGGTFSKFDDDKRLAFGWASVVELNGQPVIDRQGDVISIDEIEKASYDYMLNSRVGGRMHERTADDRPVHVSDVVESVVFTPEKCTAMGISKELAGRWWLGMKVREDEDWQRVKKGEWSGFSIHGKGLRKSTTVEELMAGLST